MDRTFVRYQMLDRMPSPRHLQPRPRLHRKRHKPEYVDGYQICGKDYWKVMGIAVLCTTIMFLIWWYGGM